MSNFCTIHQVALTQRFSKDKKDEEGNPKDYWAHNLESGGLCFGEGLGKSLKTAAYTPKAPVVAPKPVASDVMSKEEWREKDNRIARLTLAKTYIQAGVTFDAAKENGDLDEWTDWVLNG